MMWLQPENQLFKTSSIQPGGLVAFSLSHSLSNGLSGYLELEGKTRGWVAGNSYLDSSIAGRFGLVLKIFD